MSTQGPHDRRLISNLRQENLKGGAYDLRMAQDGMGSSEVPLSYLTRECLPTADPVGTGPNHVRDYRRTVYDPNQSRWEHLNQGCTRQSWHLGTDWLGGLLTRTIIGVGHGDGRLHFRLANLGLRPYCYSQAKQRSRPYSLSVLLPRPDTVRDTRLIHLEACGRVARRPWLPRRSAKDRKQGTSNRDRAAKPETDSWPSVDSRPFCRRSYARGGGRNRLPHSG